MLTEEKLTEVQEDEHLRLVRGCKVAEVQSTWMVLEL